MNTAVAIPQDIIAASLAALAEMRSEQSDGAWLGGNDRRRRPNVKSPAIRESARRPPPIAR